MSTSFVHTTISCVWTDARVYEEFVEGNPADGPEPLKKEEFYAVLRKAFVPHKNVIAPTRRQRAAAAAACCVAALLLLSLACNACFTCCSLHGQNGGARGNKKGGGGGGGGGACLCPVQPPATFSSRRTIRELYEALRWQVKGPQSTIRLMRVGSVATDGAWLLSCARGRSHHWFTRRRDTQTAQIVLRCSWAARAPGRRGRR
jgi:hypothetical protein